MSDLHRAVEDEIDAYRPDQIPPFAAVLARQRSQNRRRKMLAVAAPVLAAVLVAPVAWTAVTSGGDQLVQQAGPAPAPDSPVQFGLHPVLDVASFDPSSEPTSQPGVFPGMPIGNAACAAAAAENLTVEQTEQVEGGFVACAYNSPTSAEVYRLGPAALTGDDVAEAGPFETMEGTGDWSVRITLTAEGRAAFTALTGQAACAQMGSPQRRLAFVVDGEVVNGETTLAPVVACGVGIEGDAAVISGGFDEPEAQDLARRIAASSGAGSPSEQTNDNRLEACDRASVERWLRDSGLDAWGIGEVSSGLALDLPDTQPELSAQMKQQVLDRCGGEVSVIIGPPVQPADATGRR